MSQPQGTLYEIRWNEVCPWLILVRALRVSALIRVMALAFVGVLLTQWGWSAIDRVFTENPAGLERLTDRQVKPILRASDEVPKINDFVVRTASGPLVRAWSWLAQPFAKLPNREATWQHSLALSLSGIWTILVWALFGGAITRISAVHLTRGETLGPLVALKAALAKWRATAGAPLIVLLVVATLAVPMILGGLLLRIDFLAMFAGLFWAIILAWGMLLALALVGLLLGWPLMWATVSVERTDAFDGISRCYAYIYQRPQHLAFYVLVATCLGFLGEFAVQYFAAAAVELSEWTISWGAGNERTAELVTMTAGDAPSNLSTTVAAGMRAAQFWKWTLHAIVSSFSVGYLWSASVGIYLLLRRHIDSTEMDEIAFEAGDRQEKGLPNLETDESGVPQVSREMTNNE